MALQCYNKGCAKKFDTAENGPEACQFHPGEPVFHDAYKGWSCCNSRSTDFSVFLSFPGCAKGYHNPEKPPEPEKNDKVIIPPVPTNIPTPAPLKRPSEDDKLIDLPLKVAPTLKAQLEKLFEDIKIKESEGDKVETDNQTAEGDAAAKTVKMGAICKRRGCGESYVGESSLTETCHYHPGFPVFHEGYKYWSCCKRKTTEFDEFLNQSGCNNAIHNFLEETAATSETKRNSCRMDWFQAGNTVNISYFAKMTLPDQCNICANGVKLKVFLTYDGGKSVHEEEIILSGIIDPAKSAVKISPTKVEISLKKVELVSWKTLQKRS